MTLNNNQHNNLDYYSIVNFSEFGNQDNFQGPSFLSKPSIAYEYFLDRRVNLLTGVEEKFSLIRLYNVWEEQKIAPNKPILWHLNYELGFFILGLENLDPSISQIPLAYEFHYESITTFKTSSVDLKEMQIIPQTDLPFRYYNEKFLEGREELLAGNCYQFNLTFQQKFQLFFKHDRPEGLSTSDALFAKILSEKSNVGNFAHMTHLPHRKVSYLSNSPECLFQIKKVSKKEKVKWLCQTFPIKGTRSFDKKNEKKDEVWRQLRSDKKEVGELNMISDLLRNDLSKIQEPKAKINKERELLEAPGILHQYSEISVELDEKPNLKQLISALFPGGSITGAPKKRVVDILRKLENSQRGFYCGSTIFLHGDRNLSSINIRSGVFHYDNNIFQYGSGGGITLLSNAESEYREMQTKVQSFLSLWEKK